MEFKIREPIWSRMSVGIETAKIEAENTVEILHVDADGKRSWPQPFPASGYMLYHYPATYNRQGDALREVPIKDLEEGRHAEIPATWDATRAG